MQVVMSRGAAVLRHLVLLGVCLALAFTASAVTGWPWPSLLLLVGSGVLATGFVQSLETVGQRNSLLAGIVQWAVGTAVLALMLASLLWWLD